MNTPVFREEVKPSDVEAVRNILESSGYFYKEEINVGVELVEESLSKGISSGYHFIFAEEGERVIGYTCFGKIACTKASFDLYWIAVHNDCRSKGLGKKLLNLSEKKIASMGGKRIYVETSNRPQYESTRVFYIKCRYNVEAILKDFYGDGDDKVIFIKKV
ncbi:MAG TPA: GNAT family N-acetyltransferase [Candidatus Eremiobacteraeota bacterium]|mgnify:CR=1 FL=1|nr:MAG: putative acetyltransferase [bacterium ADurb.Bin363]HPZ07192.1 GNAT family N-acetyltransferase [Candidatus Eremiobacteraeota bacterium]